MMYDGDVDDNNSNQNDNNIKNINTTNKSSQREFAGADRQCKPFCGVYQNLRDYYTHRGSQSRFYRPNQTVIDINALT